MDLAKALDHLQDLVAMTLNLADRVAMPTEKQEDFLSLDEARLELWQAITQRKFGNPTDEKLTLEELRKKGIWLARWEDVSKRASKREQPTSEFAVSMKDQINACLQHNLGCQEREDMSDEQLGYLQRGIERATEQLVQMIERPEYEVSVGEAGDRYIRSVAYNGQHTLPVQFRWNDLFDVLNEAARKKKGKA